MEQSPLGKSKLMVSRMGLGCMGMQAMKALNR